MAEFQFVGVGAGGQGQDLIAETDAHQRFFPLHHFAHDLDGLAAHLGIAGPVGDEHAVVFLIGEIVIPRNSTHAQPPRRQTADNVILAAAIDQHHFFFTLAVFHRFCDADLLHQVDFVRIIKVLFIGEKNDPPQHRPFIAQSLGQHARIDAVQRRRLVADQPIGQASLRVPVAVFKRVFGDDQALDVNPVGFEIFIQPVLKNASGHAIVADQGIGEHQDLSVIGWIGKALRITHHAGIEHHLSGDRPLRGE
ncbi:MAG: hypothetical protein BWY83_02723 [bacterium ADurb.Bin478]|nr:MAG: hypothetical protein BWY83_02723 [bacterium ADurb.Bin478]